MEMEEFARRESYLISRYNAGELTEEEKAELLAWRAESDINEQIFQETTDPKKVAKQLQELIEDKKKVLDIVAHKMHTDRTKVIPMHRRYIAVAVGLIFLIAGAFYFEISTKSARVDKNSIENITDVPAPTGTRAVLTLADGKNITLDSSRNGVIGKQGNTQIAQSAPGEVVYTSENKSDRNTYYNTLTTPRGCQTKVVLADGSTVWLNAASSIKYPTAFIGSERTVELTGQAYFEIAPNRNMPFIVKTKESTTRVLGTHFVISAYEGEPQQTVLTQGAISVSSPTRHQVLSPGQAITIETSGKLRLEKNVDTSSLLAWKDGWFSFRNTELREVLDEVQRWYDVDIHFDKQPSATYISGSLSRKVSLSGLIKMLQLSKVNLKLDGRTIIVSK